MKENIIRETIEGFTKVEIKSFVQAMLRTNSKWAKHGVLKIFESQDASEKRTHFTKLKNGLGFTAYDAPMLSTIACKLRQNKKLMPNEVNCLMYRMPKYSVQLINTSNYKKLEKALHAYYE